MFLLYISFIIISFYLFYYFFTFCFSFVCSTFMIPCITPLPHHGRIFPDHPPLSRQSIFPFKLASSSTTNFSMPLFNPCNQQFMASSLPISSRSSSPRSSSSSLSSSFLSLFPFFFLFFFFLSSVHPFLSLHTHLHHLRCNSLTAKLSLFNSSPLQFEGHLIKLQIQNSQSTITAIIIASLSLISNTQSGIDLDHSRKPTLTPQHHHHRAGLSHSTTPPSHHIPPANPKSSTQSYQAIAVDPYWPLLIGICNSQKHRR